ncbi:hypothetical protein FKM82_023438 [Ascaphus truei]
MALLRVELFSPRLPCLPDRTVSMWSWTQLVTGERISDYHCKIVVASTPGMSVWANQGDQTFRKLGPESLTILVNCSIRHTCQILFLILGIIGKSVSFHNAAISHLVAVNKCAINLCVAFDSPRTRLPNKNNHGSREISTPSIHCSQALISAQIGATLVQDHSMWRKSALSPHCLGQSGEYPLTNLDNYLGYGTSASGL